MADGFDSHDFHFLPHIIKDAKPSNSQFPFGHIIRAESLPVTSFYRWFVLELRLNVSVCRPSALNFMELRIGEQVAQRFGIRRGAGIARNFASKARQHEQRRWVAACAQRDDPINLPLDNCNSSVGRHLLTYSAKTPASVIAFANAVSLMPCFFRLAINLAISGLPSKAARSSRSPCPT